MELPRDKHESDESYSIRKKFYESVIEWFDEAETFSRVHLNKVLYGTVYSANVEALYSQMMESVN